MILLVSADEYKRPIKRYVRAKITAGIILDPLPEDTSMCNMTHIVMMDPNGNIPQWLVNKVAPERCEEPARINALIKDS